jgi:pyruvate carboxylase
VGRADMSIKDRGEAAKKIWGKRSIKDRIEAKKKLLEQEEREEEKQKEKQKEEEEKQKEEEERQLEESRNIAKKTFAPVYEAFLEIEREYGTVGVLKDNKDGGHFRYTIEISDVICRLKLMLGIKLVSKLEVRGYFHLPHSIAVINAENDEEFYEDPELVINVVIDWIAKYIELQRP